MNILELFAGVGGFRIGLENADKDYFQTKWANQWEPSRKSQDAFEVYDLHFPDSENINISISEISDEKFAEMNPDMIVGGFPCQDYSVARSKKNEQGIEGKKGVLFWEIIRATRITKPKYLILENVDRLLKAPSKQRGRDFAIMLTAFNNLGYSVEWRVINAGEYGRSQRRRRVFFFVYRNDTTFAKRLDEQFENTETVFNENRYNEYLFHLFNSDGEEVSLTDTATATGKQIDDYNPKETSAHYTVSFIGEERPYTLLLAKNTDKESQAVEALHKALPALTIVIVAISVLAAVFYAWYMTAPIKKISKMSKQMANMDFGSLCPVERTDEIGVLSDSLNTLSSNLSAALTELKDANQKLQADIDKERELELQRIKFFSAASHELKTPITIIKGQLQGMLCGVGRYKDRETYLAQSLEVTNSLEKMVQELLTVSRIEAPQYSCVKTHFDFTQFLRQRLAAFDDLFVQKELSVAINLLPGIYIDGDIGLLQKVVDNLLGNAATYSPPGNSVRVDLRQAEEKVYLTIENTGVHIPEDDISKLFEPFYRVEQSRNRQTGGSGLGLYIVKTIINLHNAEISVQNTDDGVAIKVIF